jgi:nucleotide-binding universal stress UspA family protein
MYQTILVPLDGSKLAECVLPHVEALVRGCQVNRVVFVRAVEPFRMPTGGDAVVFSDTDIEKIEAASRAEAEVYLKNIIAAGRYDGARAELRVLNGVVAETLAEYATRNNVDLIVISTHGRSGVSRWVWGSVADRVLRSACVPVLMVRAPGCVPGI